jgi:two-component system, cell cycle response regulator
VQNNHYQVDVVGFNPTERSMLTSIFALAARRDPGFVQFDPATAEAPDLYLVDMDDAGAVSEYRALNRRSSLPAVLVASPGRAAGEEVVERPLQWARVLQALEGAISECEETMPAPLEARSPEVGEGTIMRGLYPGTPHTAPGMLRTAPGLLRTTPPVQPAAGSADLRRALGDAVLVVDDNATVRAFMQAKLAPFRFEVDFAENGEEAVGLTGSREYTCVFLDVVMPGIDGYQVCKLIKSNKNAIKKTAVVMLTSRSSPFDKLRGSLAGCDEYLTKPLDEERLLEVIAKFLPSSRKRSGSSKHR